MLGVRLGGHAQLHACAWMAPLPGMRVGLGLLVDAVVGVCRAGGGFSDDGCGLSGLLVVWLADHLLVVWLVGLSLG